MTSNDADDDDADVWLGGDGSRKASSASDDGGRCNNDGARTDFEQFRRKFSTKMPRISITDTQGQVLAVTSQLVNSEDEAMKFCGYVAGGRAYPGYCYTSEHGNNVADNMPIDLSRHTRASDLSDQSIEFLSNTTPFSNFWDNSRPLIFDTFTTTATATSQSMNQNYRKSTDNIESMLQDAGSGYLTCTAVTDRAMCQLVDDVSHALGSFSDEQIYRTHEGNRFVVQSDALALEIELHDGNVERIVKCRQLSGDCTQYRMICGQLFTCLAL